VVEACHHHVLTMTEPTPPERRQLHESFLIALISLLIACSAVGGFLIGRSVTQDAFIHTVNSLTAIGGATLLDAGTVPRSAYQVIGTGIDEPLTARALAKMYGVPAASREALVERLTQATVTPPYWPAPFVGHIGRPFAGDSLHINSLGFRDRRENLESKPERTVRIFMTGGSAAWGSYLSSDGATISAQLEKRLNSKVSPRTGLNYEVINTALPAWSTTQEQLLIQERLLDLHPDVILMFSGGVDIHWALHGADIRWFFTYMDQNYVTLLNEMYKTAGHPEWSIPSTFGSQPIDCATVAKIARRNVAASIATAERVNAQLIFVLQPNIMSTAKRLSEYELRLFRQQNKPYWDACYEGLRDTLPRIVAPNYHFLDLSRSFGNLDDNTELFVDAYHFVDLGSGLIADEIMRGIDWKAILPSVVEPARNAQQ
jgi:hypothetical protein